MDNFISRERFERYLEYTKGDALQAGILYAYNIKLSQSFYPSLHIFEITFRNKINDCLVKDYGEQWFDNNIFREDHQIIKAKKDLGSNIETGKMVAKLSFGFWASLLGRNYNELWKKSTSRSIDKKTRRENNIDRSILAKYVFPIKNFRNRIFHYEPIIFESNSYEKDILKDPLMYYKKILEITSWFSAEARFFIEENSTFHKVWAERPSFLMQP